MFSRYCGLLHHLSLLLRLHCTAQVERLLSQLDDKFESMSGQIMERSEWHLFVARGVGGLNMLSVDQMSARVDALEASIQDIISDDLSPTSPSPAPTSHRRLPSGRKSGVGS